MSFRFWRRIRLAPGVTLNLSKSGGSLSFGPRGAKATLGPRGGRATVGIPGTGLFYTTTLPPKPAGKRHKHPTPPPPTVGPADRLTLNFFQRLTTPEEEREFVEGCRELTVGDEMQALSHLRAAVHLADGAFLAGFLALKHERVDEAEYHLHKAAENQRQLGRLFSKYAVSALMTLPVTGEVTAHVGPNLRGVLLGLVEVYQRQRAWQKALDCLRRLRRLEPEDVVLKLSLAEVLLESQPQSPPACQSVVRLTAGIENESPVHAALLLYKARALRRLGLLDAARDTLTAALRRRKDRSPELLRALRYERALVYRQSGQHRRARKDLEKLYAEAPAYRDVAARLGLEPHK